MKKAKEYVEADYLDGHGFVRRMPKIAPGVTPDREAFLQTAFYLARLADAGELEAVERLRFTKAVERCAVEVGRVKVPGLYHPPGAYRSLPLTPDDVLGIAAGSFHAGYYAVRHMLHYAEAHGWCFDPADPFPKEVHWAPTLPFGGPILVEACSGRILPKRAAWGLLARLARAVYLEARNPAQNVRTFVALTVLSTEERSVLKRSENEYTGVTKDERRRRRLARLLMRVFKRRLAARFGAWELGFCGYFQVAAHTPPAGRHASIALLHPLSTPEELLVPRRSA